MMLILLLLQGATSTRVIIRGTIPPTFYIPLAVTLVAAIIAAWAAIKNTKILTKTQNDVAVLTNQTARELKDKDYKNDYYKKIIDKRIKAIEAAESLLSLFSTKYGVVNSEKVYHCYLRDDINSKKLENAVDNVGGFSIWYSPSTSDQLQSVCVLLFKVVGKARELWKKEEKAEWLDYCTSNYEHIVDKLSEVANAIGSDMLELDDVPGFLKIKFQNG